MKTIRFQLVALLGLTAWAACGSSNANLAPDDPVMVMRTRAAGATVVARATVEPQNAVASIQP